MRVLFNYLISIYDENNFAVDSHWREQNMFIVFCHTLQGLGPRVLWIGIGGSIFFGVLERTKQFLAETRPEKKGHLNSK